MENQDNNLELYEALKTVPPKAQKPISDGRLSGMTDINGMWRIKRLTEVFGPCGVGWKTENEKFYTIAGADGAIAAFCELDFLYCYNGKWSFPIHSVGGAMLVSKETKGLYTDDEALKKAKTDAIGGAGKMIGLGGSIYWNNDSTKYVTSTYRCESCGNRIIDAKRRDGSMWPAADIAVYSLRSWHKVLCPECIKKLQKSPQPGDGIYATFENGKINKHDPEGTK